MQWRGVAPPADDLPPLREWLVFAADQAEAEQQRLALQPLGLRILRRQQLPSLGLVLSVFRLPAEADVLQLERELRARFPDWQQELNQRYRPLAQPEAAELQLRNWGQRAMGRGQPAPTECGRGLQLAMLDGPVNTTLAEFAGADLHYQSLPPAQYAARSVEAQRHGAGRQGRGDVRQNSAHGTSATNPGVHYAERLVNRRKASAPPESPPSPPAHPSTRLPPRISRAGRRRYPPAR